MKEALYIVDTLNKNGYKAYFAGGWVRDHLLNHPSADIDIATDAPSNIVQKLFKKTIPIGVKFGIILVIVDNKQYEVATFRTDVSYEDGRRPSQVKFSTPDEDAKRRDFTINGMFYDPIKKEIIDFVNGKIDLEAKIIKAIGDPNQRFLEDRLRMIRAIRLSSRFSFKIDKETKIAISKHSKDLFPSVAIERVMQEFQKMSLYKGFRNSLIKMCEVNLLQTIFPSLKELSIDEIKKRTLIIEGFPKETPVIISILELFKNISLEEKIEISKYLKISNREIDFVKFIHLSKEFIVDFKNIDDYTWSLFFTSKYSEIAQDILAMYIPAIDRIAFFEKLNNKKEELKYFINKIKNKDPILKSEHLKLYNINPGLLMGQLLKDAEKISINKKIKEPHKVIEELKKTKLWPKESL